MRLFSLLILCSIAILSQPFPMRYLGELGHLTAGQRVGPARGIAQGIVQLQGPGWKYITGATGGVGWTELYMADFDADGRMDFLIGEHFPGCGHCISSANITVLLFDAAGRPVPWRFGTYLPDLGEASKLPYLPVRVIDANRDRRAEFVITACQQDQKQLPKAVLEARDGRLAVQKGAMAADELLPDFGGEMDGAIEELWGSAVGVEGKPRTKIGGKFREGWPSAGIRDGIKEREIDVGDGWDLLVDAMRKGLPVKRFGESEWFWIDGKAPEDRADLVVAFDVSSVQESGPVTPGPAWPRGTAMKHTVTGETKFETPPGAQRLLGKATVGELELTQWTPGLYALHSPGGRLVASRVNFPVPGRILPGEDGIRVVRGRKLLTVQGRFKWRRAPAR